jgi:hypothetical protein
MAYDCMTMEEVGALQKYLALLVLLEYFRAEAHHVGDQRIVVLSAHTVNILQRANDDL